MQAVLLTQITRRVRVPSGLAAPDLWLRTRFNHTGSAECLNHASPASNITEQNTYVGSYEPAPYVLPGLAARIARTPGDALLLARVASMLLSLAFISAAVWLLWDKRRATSLIGPALAVTPTVLFTSAVVSPSAVEISSSVCAFAATTALWRRPDSRAAVLALGASTLALRWVVPSGRSGFCACSG